MGDRGEQREERERQRRGKERKVWRRDHVEGPGGMSIRYTWTTAS